MSFSEILARPYRFPPGPFLECYETYYQNELNALVGFAPEGIRSPDFFDHLADKLGGYPTSVDTWDVDFYNAFQFSAPEGPGQCLAHKVARFIGVIFAQCGGPPEVWKTTILPNIKADFDSLDEGQRSKYYDNFIPKFQAIVHAYSVIMVKRLFRLS